MSHDRVLMGTAAYHQLGDISRDDPDYFVFTREDADSYYGAWLTGFGFVNVRFPKSGTRPMTPAEAEFLAANPVVIA